MKLKNIVIQNFKGLQDISLTDCGSVNAIVGKNNSGKSSILHAIDMAGLALEVDAWDRFQPKLEIKDLFSTAGDFSIELQYQDNSTIKISTVRDFIPNKTPDPTDVQKFRSILIWPDVAAGMLHRQHRTPRWILDQIEARNFAIVDSLQILYAIKYYALRNERGLSPETYNNLIKEISAYFPDIDELESDRTETDIATLTYTEYGKKLDILYSGSGLKHFIDVLLKVTISNAKILLLDEPEMGLHPELQRRFISYLCRLANEKNIQVFLATHSQVLLNFADSISYFRVLNSKGVRKVTRVPNDAIHTLLSDMGIRPSDVFNQDICLMVEGASEIVFFTHIIRELYKIEFEKVAVGVIQYGGSAAEGIISGDIDVSNIVSAQKYTYWIRDRDAMPTELPSSESTKFVNALRRHNIQSCVVLNKREIEYYYPEKVLIAAQQGDVEKEKVVIEIKNSDQSEKFRTAASKKGVCVPKGSYLRELLRNYLKSIDDLDQDIRSIIEDVLIPWKNEILGS